MQSDDGLPTRDKSAIALLPSDQKLHVLQFQCLGSLTKNTAAAKKVCDVACDGLCAHPNNRVLTADLRTNDAS